MAFQYTVDNIEYEDLSSGRVLFNQRGAAAFPVRLASEIFLRCLALMDDKERPDTYTLFDPLCGGGYLLTTRGFLHGDKIKMIYASDIDADLVSLASKNLSLLKPEDLDDRIRQIREMLDLYGKPVHREALESALRLKKRLGQFQSTVSFSCFTADATAKDSFTKIDRPVDIVITDLPYGNLVQWHSSQNSGESLGNTQDMAVNALLDNLASILDINSVVAIVSQHKLKCEHKDFERVSRFKHGKRHIAFFKKRKDIKDIFKTKNIS